MKKLLLLFLATINYFITSAQTTESIYEKQWHEIDSLIVEKDLPKSALEKVNAIYTDAKNKKIDVEVIKALLYKLSLEDKTEEQNVNRDYKLFAGEITTTSNAVTESILEVLLANSLNDYYNQNFWKNQERKETIAYKETDITTWSNGQLLSTIDSLFEQSLLPATQLKQTNIESYAAIIIKGNAPGTRPTLYDLIAHEALDYYETGLRYITEPVYAFKLTEENCLSTAEVFMNYSFDSKDTSSHLLKALQLLQQLMLFHKNDNDPTAFIDINLERIEWVNNRVYFENKDVLYKKALIDITDHYTNTKPGAEAWYLLAEGEVQKAMSYQPFGDATERYANVKAKQLIEERLKAMPDSCYGNDMMKTLLQQITKPELSTQVEGINVADQPFRLLVNYKNIDTLYAHVLVQKNIAKAAKKKNYNEWLDIPKLPFIKTFLQVLPQTNDYQNHSVEIKIDALPVGDYTILYSNSKDFDDNKDKLVTQEFSVSNLAYMRNDYDYFVVNRETGQPIKDVKAKGTIEVKQGKNKEWKTKKLKTLYTDEHGHFAIPIDPKQKENYGDVDLTLSKGDDVLEASDRIYTYSYSNEDDDEDDDDSTYEDDNSHVYFFTDRSIYRPGQTVFFKGIALTKDRKTKKYKLYHYKDNAEIDLNDANGKMIDSMFVRLNEYGSFSGKFVLPQNTLTGEFSIDTYDFEEGEIDFKVEEYKRPTFYVEFDTLKNSYRLGDTIKITGYAKAYAGNAVDNAKVSYNIQRSASFPYPYLFWKISRPYSHQTEIADSTISVDENGKFEISFIAEPDSSVDRKTEPLFNFEIETSITDANGETREEKTNVKISYKSLVLQVNIPGTADVNNFKNIFITTKNNADENIPALVNIKVNPLQMPVKAYRKRQWNKPDQFVMDKTSFENYFPYDEYAAETDYHEWKQLSAVVTDTFNTINSSNYKLKQNLTQGWYCIEVTTKDKDGSEIKDVRYIQLYDMNVSGLPSPQINFSQMLSNSGAPGDKAQLLIGTSEPDVFAIEKISGKGNDTASTFSYMNLNNNKQKIEYTIQPNDYSNIGLYYAFVKHNSFYTGGMQVYITNEIKSLQINYATYRNKTEPGSKETWAVQVSNPDNSKADAELLTSMYDASLDQFKKQEWEIPWLSQNFSIGNNWEGQNAFNNTNSQDNWMRSYISFPQKEHDEFANSGYSFWKEYEIKILHNFIGTIAQEGLKDDVVTTALGLNRESKALGYSMTITKNQNITDTGFFKTKIRGIASVSNANSLLVIIDGVITEKNIDSVDANEIDHVEVLKGGEAIAIYGSKAANGAIIVTTKGFALRNAKKKKEEAQVQIRKNFNETAFFFPQLHTDSSGNYTFSFTIPDALTQWKWMSFAHTKDLAFGLRNQTVVTQKTLMVQPNLPRFFREGDKMEITAKISNLADSAITGQASIEFFDAITNQPVDGSFQNVFPEQYFTAEANRSTVVKFPVTIPFNYNKPVTIKIIARGNAHSDGEENTIPVLSNRMLVTETLPLYMPGEGSKEFKFEKLLNNKSETLTNESITVEYTPDPIWYSIQALPYLMEFPYECAEQTFNRFYANALAAYIVAQHPQIKEVFEKWKADTSTLQSDLEKNPELKQILISETPWVIDAADETQQRKNIALLFDVVNMSKNTSSALNKLKQMQLSNGAFAWFKGGYANRYITQYILTGISKLKRLNAIPADAQNILNDITGKAIPYLDKATSDDYNDLIKSKTDLTKNLLTPTQIQYWYMRSLFGDEYEKTFPEKAFSFALQQSEKYWTKQSPYLQGMLAITLNNLFPVIKPTTKFKNTQLDIIHSLKENAVVDSTKGAFWKNNSNGYYWYYSPIETQSLLIEAFKEITPDDAIINDMQRWLILNKQTNNWGTTKATADACFALLSANAADETQPLYASILLGDSSVNTADKIKQSGTDYIKHRIEGKDVQPQMGNISVGISNPLGKSNSYPPSYGAVYWQYFEDIDKITSAASTLSITKKLFIEKNSDKGKVLQQISDNEELKVGDKVVIRLVIKCDRDMEYIHLKDMRASSMEPDNVLSEYKFQDGLSYYESTRDAATNFFISNISKGTYIIEYPVHLTHSGDFSAGIATIQCMYAPEFASHSDGIRINVEEQ